MIQKYSGQLIERVPLPNANTRNISSNSENVDNVKIQNSNTDTDIKDQIIHIKLKNAFLGDIISEVSNADGSFNKNKILDKIKEYKKENADLPNTHRFNISALNINHREMGHNLDSVRKELGDKPVPKSLIESIGKDLGQDFIDNLAKNENGEITHKTLGDALKNRDPKDVVLFDSNVVDINIKNEDPAPDFIISSLQAKFGKEFIDNADTDSNGILTNIEITQAVEEKIASGDEQTMIDLKDISYEMIEKMNQEMIEKVKIELANMKDGSGRKIVPGTVSFKDIKFIDMGQDLMINNIATYGKPDLSKIFLDKMI